MSWLPLSFATPMVLWGLVALPVIWWLLRLTPPKPQTEIFPPLRILARVLRKEETPHQSPWWWGWSGGASCSTSAPPGV